MLYVTIFLAFVLFLILLKLFSITNYKRSFIYSDCILESIEHLAKSNKKITNKGQSYNPKNLIKKINFLKKYKINYALNVDCTIFNNLEKIYNLAKSISVKKLSNIIHANNKLRIFEFTLLILDKKDCICENKINEYFSIFNNIAKLRVDELINGYETLISACLYDIEENVQEYIKTRDFKNKAKFEALEYTKDDISNLAIINNNILSAIDLIDTCKNIDFLSFHVLSNYDVEDLVEISNISKRFKLTECQVDDKIKAQSISLDKSYKEILYNYPYSIKFKIKVFYGFYLIWYFSEVILFNLLATFILSFIFYFDLKIRFISLNFLAILRLSKFCVDKHFTGFLTKKCFTRMKNSSSLYKSVNLLSIFSGVFLMALLFASIALDEMKIFYNFILLFIIYPAIYFGEKFKYLKNNFYKDKNLQNNLKQDYESINVLADQFKSMMYLNEKIKLYVDSLGNNFIAHINENIQKIKIESTLGLIFGENSNCCQYIGENDNNKNYLTNFYYNYVEFKNLKNNFAIKIYPGQNGDEIIYKICCKNDLTLNINIKFENLNINIREITFCKNSFLHELIFLNIATIKKKDQKFELIKENKCEDVYLLYKISENANRPKIAYDISIAKTAFFANETNFQILRKNNQILDMKILTYLSFLIFNSNRSKYKQVFVNSKFCKIRTNVYYLQIEDSDLDFSKIGDAILYFYKSGQNFKVFIFYKNCKINEKYFNLSVFKFVNLDKISIKNEQKLKAVCNEKIDLNKVANFSVKISSDLIALQYIDSISCGTIEKDEKIIKINQNKAIIVKNIDFNALCIKRDNGYILNYGFFKIFSKNILLKNFQKMFVIYGDKIYNLWAYILKNALICNNSYIESKVSIENDIFNIKVGICNENVCFFIKISIENLQKSSNFSGILLDFFDAKIMHNICEQPVQKFPYKCFLINYLISSKKLYFTSNCNFIFSHSLISYYSLDHKFLHFDPLRKNKYSAPSFAMFFSRDILLKNEQKLEINFLENLNFLNNKNNYISTRQYLPKFILHSKDTKLKYLLNYHIFDQLLAFVYSGFDYKNHNFNSVSLYFTSLEILIFASLDLVKKHILEYFNHVFLEGDVLDEYINLVGIRNKKVINSISLMHLLGTYLHYTQDFELLNFKISPIKQDLKIFLNVREKLTISNLTFKLFNFINENLKFCEDILLYYESLLLLKNYLVHLEHKIIEKIVNLKEMLLNMYNHNYFSLKNTTCENILNFLNLDVINHVQKTVLFNNLKINFNNLTDTEKLLYMQVKSKLFNINLYDYDFIFNPLKNNSVYFSSAKAATIYFKSLLNCMIGVNFSEFFIDFKNVKAFVDQYKIDYFYNSKKLEILVEKSKQNDEIIIDNQKVKNIDNIDVLKVKKFIKIKTNRY